MAEVKKTATEKQAAVQTADTKKEEVKEVKEAPKAEKKKPGRKPSVKKAAEKKTTVKKAAAKETTTAAKTAGRKPAVKATVEIQFAGNTHTPEELIQSAKDIWEYDLHKAPADFKTVELYVKPEDNKVYYVINKDSENEASGDFNF
ncbi:MAG: hypothetical protein K2H40_11735 [Lachnospiraceae bacterium]|nr:hypothetical protein [Lachnospiraceae bacterium]